MKKFGARLLTSFLTALLLTTVFSSWAIADNEDTPDTPSGDGVDGHSAILDYYDQHKNMAAALGIAMIGDGNTEFLYLGDIENDHDFVFDWASNTKVITWVCVMQLVEQGKIDLETDIRTYLPDRFLKRLRFREPITMLNLMNHDAGFQEMIADLFAEDKTKIPSLDQALYEDQPLQIRRPGANVAYSNFGVALAGYIVQLVSGQEYGDYVKTHVFDRLDMKHTSIKADHSDNQWVEDKWKTGKSYWISSDGEKNQLGAGGTGMYASINPRQYGIFTPAGSATGTIEDFAKFVQALIPDSDDCPLFESSQTLAEMYQPTLYYADGTPRNAHGMWTEQFGNGLFGHGGNSEGFSSNFMIDPVAKKAYVVMTNVVGESTFCHQPLQLIFGDYKWGDPDFSLALDLSGHYNFMRGYTDRTFKKFDNIREPLRITQSEKDNVFLLSINGDVFSSLTRLSDRVFIDDNVGLLFFVRDDGVLQCGVSDVLKVNPAWFYTQWALTIIGLLSCFFAVGALIAKGTAAVVQKSRKQEITTSPNQRWQLLSLGFISVALAFLLLMLFGKNSFTVGVVYGWIASISAVAAVGFGIKQVIGKSQAKAMILRIATLVASVLLLANVLHWEIFNFWSR